LNKRILSATFLVTLALLAGCSPSLGKNHEAGAVNLRKEVMSEIRVGTSGEVLEHRLRVRLTLENNGTSDAEVTVIDRVLGGSAETVSTDGPKPDVSHHGSVLYLTWRDVRVPKRSKRTISYSVGTSLRPPVRVKLSYTSEGRRIEPLDVAGTLYLSTDRGSKFEIVLTLANELEFLTESGVLYYPMSLFVTLQLPSRTLGIETIEPEPLSHVEVGGTSFYTWALQLTGGEERVTLNASILPDAEIGVVEMGPVSASILTMPVGNLTDLIETRDRLNRSLAEINSIREGLSAYFDMISSLNDTIGNLTDLSIALDLLASGSENFSRAIDAIESIADVLVLQTNYMVDGLIKYKGALKGFLALGGGETNQSMISPDDLKEGIDALIWLALSTNDTAEYLSAAASALDKGSGRYFETVAECAEETRAAVESLESALQELNVSAGDVRTLIESLESQSAEVERQISSIESRMELARLVNPISLPASIGEPRLVPLYPVLNGTNGAWNLTALLGAENVSGGSPALLYLSFEEGEIAVTPRGTSSTLVDLSSMGIYLEDRALTMTLPKGANLSELLFAEGGPVITVLSADKPAASAWVDVPAPQTTEASYHGKISCDQPRVTVEFTPRLRSPPAETPAPPPPEERGFEFETWMWYPLLAVPVLLVLLLMLSDLFRPREEPWSEEHRELLGRIAMLQEKLQQAESEPDGEPGESPERG